MTQLIRSLQADLREGGLYEGKANGNWGASPGEGAGSPGWGMRRELLSPRYTTGWSGLWKVGCR